MKHEKQDVYQKVTEKIIEKLEQGEIPWQKPWYTQGMPINWQSEKPYNGTNLLMLEPGKQYITYLQAKEAGGTIKKGAKAIPIIFAKQMTIEDENAPLDQQEKEKNIMVLKHYNVFEVGRDTIGIEPKERPEIVRINDPIAEAEKIVKDYQQKHNISITQDGGDRAYYRPSSDSIHLPKMEHFKSSEEFYSTALHEVIHSTGHHTRLNRLSKDARFGNEKYSKEELVAEFGSAFLSDKAGISQKVIENQTAYIQGWSKALKEDKTLIVKASTQAMKAADFVQGSDRYKEETQEKKNDRIVAIEKVKAPKKEHHSMGLTEYKWQAKQALEKGNFTMETDKGIIEKMLIQGFEKLKLQGILEKASPIQNYNQEIQSMKDYSKNIVKQIYEKVKDKIKDRER